MSYSRWSNSSWYTFWNVSSGKDMEEQVLSAWYSLDKCLDWTYGDLEDFTRGSHEDIVKRIEIKYGCNGDEATELYEYIQEFMADVRAEFNDRPGS